MKDYTPGPRETGAGFEKANASLYVCAEGGGDVIAEVVSWNVADRDLIAVAPELLEAIRYLRRFVRDVDTDYVDSIIAKAEGR